MKMKFKPRKEYDFSSKRGRKVALRISYFGQNYHGFTGLPTDSIPTIERELFKALKTCKLIPEYDQCDWSRCGRTDKGVSGFGQVVSLWIRTNLETNSSLPWSDIIAKDYSKYDETGYDCIDNELYYISMINRLLPEDIRILAWTPVKLSFDARFSCEYRKYKYYFPKRNLNIAKMKQAAELFIGTHDCRHLCKIDSSKADNELFFTRTIYESYIEDENDDFCAFIVKGKAFLWHQVRNMMAILYLVGQLKEEPEIVSYLLDLSKHPDGAGKPNYALASDLPLILLECGYKDIKWILNHDSDQKQGNVDAQTLSMLGDLYYNASLKALQIDTLMKEYEQLGAMRTESVKEENYIPLIKRKRCDSLQLVASKQKLKKQ